MYRTIITIVHCTNVSIKSDISKIAILQYLLRLNYFLTKQGWK
jgi:hypothetical protein